MVFPLAFDAVWFGVLLGLTALTGIALRIINGPLRTPAAPHRIVSLELADFERAQAILDSWDTRARLHAAMGLGFDYLFLALYGATLALGCAGASETLAPHVAFLGDLGPWLAWGACLAAVLDAIENDALWTMLREGPTRQLTVVARACAFPKFLLIGLTVIYVLPACMIWLFG
jgi:hypothetical protein